MVSTTSADRKFSRTNLAEALASLVLLSRDDRGVRDLQPQRMAEEGGDGEPVGQRADHPGLGRCTDVSEPPRPAPCLAPLAGQEDDGRADQESQRHRLHPPQIAQPLDVGLGVGAGERLSQGGDGARRQFRETMFSCHATIIRYFRPHGFSPEGNR